MLMHIEDHCPSASPARESYLLGRVERLVAHSERTDLASAKLRASVEPDTEHDWFNVELEFGIADGSALVVRARRANLPPALAELFGAAAFRLSRPPPVMRRTMRRGA